MKFRIAALLFVCPIALAAPLSAAPAPAPARSAAPIELHIDAQAQVEADRVEVVLAVTASGVDEGEVTATLTANHEALVGQLKELGIDTTKLVFKRNSQSEVIVSNSVSAAADAAVDAAADPAKKKKKKSAEAPVGEPYFYRQEDVTIVLADRTQADKLLEWSTMHGGGIEIQSFRETTSNPDKARRAAREKAIAKARQDADEYAGLMGYHVVRVVRVSNARPVVSVPDMLDFIVKMETSSRTGRRGMPNFMPVETVSIDFLIAPN